VCACVCQGARLALPFLALLVSLPFLEGRPGLCIHRHDAAQCGAARAMPPPSLHAGQPPLPRSWPSWVLAGCSQGRAPIRNRGPRHPAGLGRHPASTRSTPPPHLSGQLLGAEPHQAVGRELPPAHPPPQLLIPLQVGGQVAHRRLVLLRRAPVVHPLHPCCALPANLLLARRVSLSRAV